MAIQPATLRQLRQLIATVGEEADDATRQITQVWLRSWDELAPAWREAIAELVAQAAIDGRWPPPWQMARMGLLTSATIATGQALATVGATAGLIIAGGTAAAITATAEAEPTLIASQLPAAMTAAAAAGFAAAILPSPLALIGSVAAGRVTALIQPIAGNAIEEIRRSLARGVVIGTSPMVMTRAVLGQVETAFNNGLTSALTAARTEIVDAYRAASQYVQETLAGTVGSWVWVCLCDPRSCPACWAMHGRTFPNSEPGPLGHPGCRCARLAVVKSWRTLGVGGTEPEGRVPDGRALFAALPQADQLAILGPTRLALLTSGRIGWDDLAVRRDNLGWRPSWVPRTGRDLKRLADRRGN